MIAQKECSAELTQDEIKTLKEAIEKDRSQRERHNDAAAQCCRAEIQAGLSEGYGPYPNVYSTTTSGPPPIPTLSGVISDICGQADRIEKTIDSMRDRLIGAPEELRGIPPAGCANTMQTLLDLRSKFDMIESAAAAVANRIG